MQRTWWAVDIVVCILTFVCRLIYFYVRTQSPTRVGTTQELEEQLVTCSLTAGGADDVVAPAKLLVTIFECRHALFPSTRSTVERP